MVNTGFAFEQIHSFVLTQPSQNLAQFSTQLAEDDLATLLGNPHDVVLTFPYRV
jgi:flagellar assembly factor FliW